MSGRVLAISPNNQHAGHHRSREEAGLSLWDFGRHGSDRVRRGRHQRPVQSGQFDGVHSDGRWDACLFTQRFTGWSARAITSPASGVAVTIPAAGVYLASNPVDVRSNCPITVANGNAPFQTTTNTFYPEIGPVAGGECG